MREVKACDLGLEPIMMDLITITIKYRDLPMDFRLLNVNVTKGYDL